MNLSPNFKLAELTHSNTAVRLKIDNFAPPEVVDKLKVTASMLERIRSLLGTPVQVTSGYRGPVLNKKVGGVTSSDHLTGEAADIIAPKFGPPSRVASKLAENFDKLGIGQLILEQFKTSQWVHVSTKIPSKVTNRILTINENGATPGIRSVR